MLSIHFTKNKGGKASSSTQINSPSSNLSPLERGVNTLTSCWRTGHGDHRPTLRVHLRSICYLCLPLYTFALARNKNNVCAHKTPRIV